MIRPDPPRALPEAPISLPAEQPKRPESPENPTLPPTADGAPPKRGGPGFWVNSTYFAEGLPYMLVRFLTGVYFTDIGAPETLIGRLNLLGLPWNWKFVWAPLVDWLGTRRRWMVAVQLALAACFGLLTFLVHSGPPSVPTGTKVELAQLQQSFDPLTGLSHATVLELAVGLLVLLAFLAATNDVAIDAYFIEGLPDRRDQALYSGMRVTAYRVAVLFAKFALVALPTWTWGFGIGAGVMAAIAIGHALFVPRFPSDVAKTGADRPPLLGQMWHSARTWLSQPRMWLVVPFIILYKLGDEILFALNSTFLLRELHVTKPQLAWLSGAVGTVTAIAGTMLGAWWIKKVGLKRAIWPLTLAMNLTIWAYVWLAWAKPDAQSTLGIVQIAMIHGYEQIAVGLGNAALTMFLLLTCKPEYKAAHYAFGSAIMSLTGTLLGSFTGDYVKAHGYTSLYVLSFIGSVPSMILLFFVPISDDAGKS